MDEQKREQMIATIQKREGLRKLTRWQRFLADPFRTSIFYPIALLGHLKPFLLSFKTLWGDRMECYLPDGNTFFYYGYCEANLASFFLRIAKEGMVFVDAGAHVGFYSMLLAHLVGESGSVHAFEPTPETFKHLVVNTEKLKNVTVNNLGLSNEKTTLSFADYGPGYGAYNSAHATGGYGLSKTSHMIAVEATTIDAYCKEHAVLPSIIKIDTEGFEYQVLRGAQSILESEVRPIITLEVAGGEQWAESRDDALEFLAARKYRVFTISQDGYLLPHDGQRSYEYDNLAFIPTERVAEFSSLIK